MREKDLTQFWEGIYYAYESMVKMDAWHKENNPLYNEDTDFFIDRQLIGLLLRAQPIITKEDYEAHINAESDEDTFHKEFRERLRKIKDTYYFTMQFN